MEHASIGAGLAKAALAGKVDGRLVDTSHRIEHNAQLAIVTAAANPDPNLGLIDRAVIAADDAGITVLILHWYRVPAIPIAQFKTVDGPF